MNSHVNILTVEIENKQMSLNYQILGKPFEDNALLINVDTGQAMHRLLFDCGEGCLSGLKPSEIKSIDHLFFSHLHMDHLAGFDTFFRVNYNREQPVSVWGPEQTAAIMHHRFRGFMWNLIDGSPGSWYVTDVYPNKKITYQFNTGESFATAHFVREEPFDGLVFDSPHFFIEARILDHDIPCLAYAVKEKSKLNIDREALRELDVTPGRWLERIKNTDITDDKVIDLDNRQFQIGELRERLLIHHPGESIAYLSDFLMTEEAESTLAKMLQNCDVMICEAQYAEAEIEFARQNYHLVASQAARLAQRVNAKKLILIHLSERYKHVGWQQIVEEARAIFPETYLPEHCKFG